MSSSRRSALRRTQSRLVQSQLFVVDRVRLAVERRAYARLDICRRSRVSIPIATYDRIDVLLERTIPALLDQSHPDVEVIIVGDGSDPRDFARIAAVDDPRVSSILLPHRTTYPPDPLERWMVAGWRPRNIGAHLASGGWLLWMSDDDVILPSGVERLLKVADADPVLDAVSGGYEAHTRPPTVVTPSTATFLPFSVSGMPALIVRSFTRAFRWNGASYMKDWDRPSDYDLLARMHRAGVRFGATEEVVAVIPEVGDTGQIGSRAFAVEERRRAAQGSLSQSEEGRGT